MKVGDYVRFKTLSREIKIGKVIDIIEPDKDSMKKYCVYDLDNNEATVDDYIIKSSSNLTDLIEYGDIVKYKIDDEEFISEVWGEKNNYFVQNFDVPIDLRDLNIKSIVTKENFESMEYKIGE